MHFAPGVELGGYRLISRIGAGGMGEVWRAEDKRLGRSVAIKILPPGVAVDEESRARFEREARTAAQISHPNVATIYSFDEIDGRAYIAMEYIEGESLGAAIRRGPLPESEVCRIARGVAEALREAHQRGIVHRDIKPDNILLSGERVKVLDFGIAKYAANAGAASQQVSPQLTQTGMILGTVQYMSPEQALGRPLDHRTDLFSLGVVMYEALSGHLPFGGESVTDTLAQIIRDEPLDVTMVAPQINPSLADVIRKCLAKDPQKRISNATELIAALDLLLPTLRTVPATRVATVRVTPTAKATAPAQRRSRARWVIPVAVLTVMVGAAIAIGLGRREPGTDATPTNSQPAAMIKQTPATTIDVAPTETVAAPAVSAPETSVAATSTAPATSAPEVAPAKQAEPAASPTASETAAARAQRHHDDGMRILHDGHPRAAGVEFAAALVADPHHAPSRLRIAEGLLAKGHDALAREEFRRTLEDRDRLDGRELLLAEIGFAFTSGEVDQARTLAQTFKSRYPEDRELAAVYRAVTDRKGDEHPGRRVPPGRRPRRF